MREVCPDCLRPVGATGWGVQNSAGRIELCECGTVRLSGGGFSHHGLDNLENLIQSGTTTYG